MGGGPWAPGEEVSEWLGSSGGSCPQQVGLGSLASFLPSGGSQNCRATQGAAQVLTRSFCPPVGEIVLIITFIFSFPPLRVLLEELLLAASDLALVPFPSHPLAL